MNDYNKLTDITQQYNILSHLERKFKKEFGLTPCVGAEIEFYIANIEDITVLEQKIRYKIKSEKGHNQYEVDILPSKNLALYAKHIDELRRLIIFSAKELGGRADFTSKPFPDDYGNSMHIHLNFLEDNDLEKYAKILCNYLPETLDYFLPQKADYLRLDSNFMAPTHICYGGNNRTVLIRIPDSSPRRLEHRLAAASANPFAVLYIILKSIEKGLSNPENIRQTQKIFGNGFDPQYNLPKIKKNCGEVNIA